MVPPTQPPPADRDSVSWALHLLAVSTARVDVLLGDQLGLTSSDYLAMKHLLSADPPIGPVELGRLLGISSGSATGLVDRLERTGHVQRSRHPADRRRVTVIPTEAAVARIVAAIAPLGAALDEVAGVFTVDERAAIERFLSLAAATQDQFSQRKRTDDG